MNNEDTPLRTIPSSDGDKKCSESVEESLRVVFNDIFISQEKGLFKLAFHLTKDQHIARDIVHDVFLKLWETRDQFEKIKSMESFLFILTRNKVMDYLRKASADVRLKETIWHSMQQISAEPIHPVEDKEFRSELQQAIDMLPPQRKIIYLMRDEGYNYKEIANELQISHHTVKNQLSAALKSIRKLLKNFQVLLCLL
ncbi:RNA polymerase sigma factor [Sphingobacterium faecale]|uniref:RNA polymerase sigma-70 factor n=1 Tax=Sphingobacterium faecale TaxID=2803775 RepID=A0ABS1R0Q3_9SPHI|nr:RNA polymerase sigma-70 factor [Sphingobacterium faecale]MBL1408256.1 RNA polymerase sigma-70 factor [Sphingobacterium faecale]